MDSVQDSIKRKYIYNEYTTKIFHSISRDEQYLPLQLVQREGAFESYYPVTVQAEKRTPIQYADIFKGKTRKQSVKKVLVEGDAGIGKTTLSISLSRAWACGDLFQEFELLLLLPLSCRRITSATSLTELIQIVCGDSNLNICESMATSLNKVLFIVDGWDELCESDLKKGSILQDVVFGDIPSVAVIVTSRPSAHLTLPHVDRYVEICGFSKEAIIQCIHHEFSSEQEKAGRLLERLTMNPALMNMCSVPINCAVMCHIFEEELEEALPFTMRELYTNYFLHVLTHESGSNTALSLERLPHDLQQQFQTLCKFAFNTIADGQIIFSCKEIDSYFPKGIPVFLQCTSKSELDISYTFLHLTLQECLAAMYVAQLSTGKIFDFFGKSKNQDSMIAKMLYFGYDTKTTEGCDLMQKILPLLSSKKKNQHWVQRSLCHCILEAKNEVVSSIIGQYISSKGFNGYSLTAHDCDAVIHAIARIPGDSNVVINFSNCGNNGHIKMLKDVLLMKKGDVQVSELDLSCNGLSDDCVSELFSEAAIAFPSLQKIYLGGNLIQAEGVESMLSAISKSSSPVLKVLDLSNNPLSAHAVQALINAICANKLTSMEILSLCGSLPGNRDDNGMQLNGLMQALYYHCDQMPAVDLSENDLCISEASAMGRNISSSQMFSLYLNKVNLCDDGVATFIRGLNSSCQIEVLELESNNISSVGASNLADAICSRNISISKLNLANNPLGLNGTQAIFRVLTNEHCDISSIILSGCHLTDTFDSSTSSIAADQVTRDVGQQLLHMPQSCAITYLNLDKNNFSGPRNFIVCGFINLCPDLQDLSCNTCGINCDDIKQIIHKLKTVKEVKSTMLVSLKSWDLGNNEINDSGVSCLLNHIPSLLPSIYYGSICLHSNPVSDTVAKSLQEVIKGSKVSNLSASRHFAEVRQLDIGSNPYLNEVTDSELSILNVYNCKAQCCSKLEELTHILNVGSSQVVLIEGCTGAGKSSLVHHLVHRNKISSYQLILFFNQDIKVLQRIQNMRDVAEELKVEPSQLHSDIENAGANVLFVLDGFDEVEKSKKWQTNMFGDILLRKIFPLSSIVVLSRPSGIVCLTDIIHIDQHFQLKGLSNDDPKNTISPLQFQEHWITIVYEQHPSFLKFCEIPLIAQLVCKYLKQEKDKSNSLTDIMVHVTTELIKREMKLQGKMFESNIQLLDLPPNIISEFENFCKLAYESIISSSLLTTPDELNRFISSFNLNNTCAISESLNFGLLDNLSHSRIEFLHPLIRDFLAGYYLSLQPPLDQLALIHQYISRQVNCKHVPVSYLFLFFFGITWQRKSELNLNPTKLMITTLIEFPASCLELKNADTSEYNLTLMLCVAETKDGELWKKLVTKLGGELSLQLTSDDIQRYKWTIATMVSSSNVKEWNIHASDTSISEKLELFMAVRINKLEVPSMDRSVIKLSPKVSIVAASKKQREVEKFAQYPDKELAMMNYFQCRAIREILQRALAIFTESIRLKGDASNPSYVSFLNCKCFQKNVENNLNFDPPLPFHFLEVTSKKTLQKLQEEHGLHLASEHDGKATELVILLKPCLRRITIQYKSNIHYVVIMSEELAQNPFGKGAVASMVADLGEEISENFITCTEEHVSSAKSLMVRPSLPLPPKIEENLRATAVLPQVVTANISHMPMVHPNMHGESEQYHQKQHEVRESSRNQAEKLQGEAVGSLSSQHSFNCNFPVSLQHHHQQLQTTTTTATATATHQTKSNIKPGAILYTSDPRQIPSDLVHSLPDESHQLRRGGNGQIFKGTMGGMNVIYKKTNYRSREYAIITKIKHTNIVKLLAFMYGAENPAHKRRHFCYHIMPQMSGDCARMLTDKEHLTIRELQKKYGDNIRKMGMIRGNLKYLLKQVLEGLRYLHSLHIAHRDIKGSNILLRFFCSCTNPLECGCDTKYQVKICDYDAAVELQYVDKIEQLPPTSVGSRTTSQKSLVYYVSVPVGTNGFRSPECSMLSISSHPDSFSPPIMTRTDIWSVGILTLRILIGVNGPYTQREMALLLLHYHRQRYMCEGLHKYGYVEVDRLVTDKLLHLPQLVNEVGWLKGAVRFIECCVAIDPLARHSAEALLQHDFLY